MARRLPRPERHRLILDAAVRHFARYGFGGARTRGIARDCGITEALLFRHFPGKKALYRTLLDDRLGRSGREIYPPYARFKGDDAAFLSFLASGLLTRMGSDPHFTRLLLYSALEKHDLAQGFVDRRVRKSVDYLARWIRKRQREGAFRRVDPRIAARAFLGMVVHHCLLTHLLGYSVSGKGRDLPRLWAELFLSGVRS